MRAAAQVVRALRAQASRKLARKLGKLGTVSTFRDAINAYDELGLEGEEWLACFIERLEALEP